MFRLLVAGGRDFYDYKFIDETLTNWLDEISISLWQDGLTVVHGDAAGVDRIAAQWAKYNNFIPEPHMANWTQNGKMAGHLRNSEMIASGLDYAILFPGGRGTKNMHDQLKLNSIVFLEVFDSIAY